MPDYKCSKFFTSLFAILCKCLGSSLAMEHLTIKSSMLFKCRSLLLKSTMHPPDVIQVISIPSSFQFYASLPLPCIIDTFLTSGFHGITGSQVLKHGDQVVYRARPILSLAGSWGRGVGKSERRSSRCY